MLTQPDITDDRIVRCVRDHFGLDISHATFLPVGADINSAAYRVTAGDSTPYFLKLRKGNFEEVAVAVPAFLRAQGMQSVMAPIATTTHQLWVHAHGFDWLLYPFFAGQNGYEVALSQAQWNALGASMKMIHCTRLPDDLAKRVRREDFSPQWRNTVKAFDKDVTQDIYEEPIAARLAGFWNTKRAEIHCIVERAEELAYVLLRQAVEMVVCHADLHAGNVLVGAGDELAIVDWDEVLLAPKERDLMFVGGGLFGNRNLALEAPWFYAGYGSVALDPVVLAYYRYERIVADIAAYAEQIFGMQGDVEDRKVGLNQLMDQFLPNQVVQIAHRSYPERV